jgi:membrane protein DedA with SNARE-associated domain
LEDILDSLSEYGYIILFFYSLGGGFFAMLGAGVLSSIGKMDMATSISVGFLSNAIGDMILFYIARNNKKEVFKYLRGHRRKLAYAHILIKKYDSLVIFIQKFIYGVKTVVPIAIGLTKYGLNKFILLNLFASSLWAVVVGFIGFYSGEYVISFFNWLNEYSIFTPLLAILLFYLMYRFIAKNSQKG